MKLSLDVLMTLMPPPEMPTTVGRKGLWSNVEQQLALTLPHDYKEFVDTYGTGAIDNFLWILSPFSNNRFLNLIRRSVVTLEAQRQFSEMTGSKNPYPLHPDADGLFPWGITDNGDVLYWLCVGPPDVWKIVVCDSRASDWREFSFQTVEFLVAVVTRQLVVDVFPDSFPSASPRWTPALDRDSSNGG